MPPSRLSVSLQHRCIHPLDIQKVQFTPRCPSDKDTDFSFLYLGFLWRQKSSEQPIHKYKVLAIVVTVGRVMDGMISSSHYWIYFAIDAIMNIRRPHR